VTTKKWIGAPGEQYTDAAAWTPAGAPATGDTAIIPDGNPVLSGYTLTNLTIVLGSTAFDPGPGYYLIDTNPSPGNYTGNSFHSPNPTLEMNDGTVIGANTVIEAPQTPITTGGTLGATILINDSSVNDGTIGLPVNGSGIPSVLDFDITSSFSGGTFTNNGTINISPQQTSYLSGFTYHPPEGYLDNNGVINVYGRLIDPDVEIEGSGVVNLDAISNGLGLPPTPSMLELDGPNIIGGVIDPSQNIVFNGGELVLGIGSEHTSYGTLENFASNPSSMIVIQDFTLNTDTQTGNTVTLTGSGKTFTLNFANLPTTTGELYYVPNGSSLDVVWHPYPVDPNPIHAPPTPPGGHKLI
jgi:hypothetical protein